MLYALVGTALLAFGAIGIDLAMVRLAQQDAQDVADAASQSALLELRASGDTAAAEDLARRVVLRNQVMGQQPELTALEFGTWDAGSFSVGGEPTNAVRAVVGSDVQLALARIFGEEETAVEEDATSAARPLHVLLVIDITNSWSQANFTNARLASLGFFDSFTAAAGPDDRIGMVVFTGRYGVEHTPLMKVTDALANGVRADWAELRTASKAGVRAANGNCNVYGGGNANNFADPLNGCYPNMWREYLDESGTDHTTGLMMAQTMFSEVTDPSVYRAVLLLTDGLPNGTGAHQQRAAAGYTESRWRSYQTPVQRTTAQVTSDTQTVTQQMWTNQEVHLWAVSFVQDAAFLRTAVKGDGYYVLTSSSSALVPIFQDVAESLPVSLVE